MELISEELDRYSLELSEDEETQKEELTVPSVDFPSEKIKASLDRHGLKSDMNFPAISIASATAWNKRRPQLPPQAPTEDPAQAKDVVRYMNTYRLESKKPFNVEAVTAVLQEIMTRDLATAHYEPNNMTKMCVNLAGEIRNKVKQLNYDRYKLVCLVQIVEKHRQSVLSTARFLWDADRDKYAAFSLNNAHIAAMACVFGIYYE